MLRGLKNSYGSTVYCNTNSAEEDNKNTLLQVVSLFKSHSRNSLAVILQVFFHVAFFLVNSYLVSPVPFLFYF